MIKHTINKLSSVKMKIEDILKHADNIVNKRKEEIERNYGPFGEGMERAASIATASTGKIFTTEDMFIAMVALKLSRNSYAYKYDNILDAICYLAGLDAYHNQKNQIKNE